jgi:hypothetical protein
MSGIFLHIKIKIYKVPRLMTCAPKTYCGLKKLGSSKEALNKTIPFMVRQAHTNEIKHLPFVLSLSKDLISDSLMLWHKKTACPDNRMTFLNRIATSRTKTAANCIAIV